jgi:hypothetical protein
MYVCAYLYMYLLVQISVCFYVSVFIPVCMCVCVWVGVVHVSTHGRSQLFGVTVSSVYDYSRHQCKPLISFSKHPLSLQGSMLLHLHRKTCNSYATQQLLEEPRNEPSIICNQHEEIMPQIL